MGEDLSQKFSRTMKLQDNDKKKGKIIKVHFTEEDKKLCGLGLDEFDVLYRVCRKDEDIHSDIVCKAVPIWPIFTSAKTTNEQVEIMNAEKAVNQHIHSGHIPTQFISCTASKEVALEWAFYDKEKNERPKGEELPIIEIYIAKIPDKTRKFMINLNNKEVRGHFLKGKIQKDFAKGAQEVLFQWKIPKKTSCKKKNVFELLKNPQKPPPPKKKNKKKKGGA